MTRKPWLRDLSAHLAYGAGTGAAFSLLASAGEPARLPASGMAPSLMVILVLATLPGLATETWPPRRAAKLDVLAVVVSQ